MPWIQNCAAADIPQGSLFHKDPGPNSMLIQIMDPASWFPKPGHTFKEVHQFEFLDIEADDQTFEEEWRCSQDQANKLVQLLQRAKENDMNVIVHCYAGICRSGAVAEIGVMLGFDDTRRYRQPNLLVKHQMMKALGINYDENEISTPVNLSSKYGWEEDI